MLAINLAQESEREGVFLSTLAQVSIQASAPPILMGVALFTRGALTVKVFIKVQCVPATQKSKFL